MKIIISKDKKCILTCERLKKSYVNPCGDKYQIVVDLGDEEIVIGEYFSKDRAIAVLRFVATFLGDESSDKKTILKMPDEEYAQELLELIKKQNS